MTMPPIAVGSFVRSTYRGKALRGYVLSHDNPRAWRDLCAFPGREPSDVEVVEYLARVPTDLSLYPVLWTGSALRDPWVWWEHDYDLLAEDAEWLEA